MKDLLEKLDMNIKESEARTLSPLVYAYVGDALYEIYIRYYIVSKYKVKVNNMHKNSTKFVKASAQAQIVHALTDYFTEDEWKMIKKGRNHKTSTVAKNASITDYRYATGFECLLGYLFITKKYDRVEEIVIKAIEIIEEIDI